METRNPVRAGVAGAYGATLLADMTQEAQRYAERFLDRAGPVRGFVEDVATAREQPTESDVAETS